MDAVILAGGENRRFSSHKGLAALNGRKIVEIIAESLRTEADRIYISTNTPEDFSCFGHRMIGDVVDVRGPLTGILSAFVATGATALLVVACDMPYLKADIVRLILASYGGQDAVVPVFDGRPQPLPGIYSRTVVDRIEERIRNGRLRVRDLLQEDMDVFFVDEAATACIDPAGFSFINVNTREDLDRLSDCTSPEPDRSVGSCPFEIGVVNGRHGAEERGGMECLD